MNNVRRIISTMKNFQNLKCFKPAWHYFNLVVYRKLSSGNSLLNLKDCYYTKKENFHDDQLLLKYNFLKSQQNIFRVQLCNELFEECKINNSLVYLYNFQRSTIIGMDIKILNKHGVLSLNSDQISLTDHLLSYLEPFPFDSKCLSLSDKNSFPQSQTIKIIRDTIEKQYLAWKFSVDLEQINEMFLRFQSGFYICRSLRNLKRCCSFLYRNSLFLKENLSKKIYLIHQYPLNDSVLWNFKNIFSSLSWETFVCHGGQSLKCPFSKIQFLIKILEEKKFTSEQIQESLPFLNIEFSNFLKKLNFLLNEPVLAQYRKENKFLRLLSVPTPQLMDLENINCGSLEELFVIMDQNCKKIIRARYPPPVNVKSIKFCTSSYFSIGEEHLDIIRKHPKYSLSTAGEMEKTLSFLKEKQFSTEEILESIIIILYPRNVIAEALKKVEEESEALKEIGYVRGCVPKKTNFFKTGTKSTRKTLQLCLYYIEKQFFFT